MTAILRDKTYGNNPSNKDVETILKSLPGLGISPEANARIIWNLQQETERQLELSLQDAKSFEFTKTGKFQKVAQTRLNKLKKDREKEFKALEDRVRRTTNAYFSNLNITPTPQDLINYGTYLTNNRNASPKAAEQYRRFMIHKTYSLLRRGGV